MCSATPALVCWTSRHPGRSVRQCWPRCKQRWSVSFNSFKSARSASLFFLGYTVTDTQRADVSGSNGALLTSTESRNRWLEVSVRTGSYTLDNSHKVGERQQSNGGPGTSVPVDDDAEVLRRAIWLETNKQYEASSQALIKIKPAKK